MARTFSIPWGVAGLVNTIACTVNDAAGNNLIARSTAGFVDVGHGGYLLTISGWDPSWGASVTIDDGTTYETVWFDPLPALNDDGTVQATDTSGNALATASSVSAIGSPMQAGAAVKLAADGLDAINPADPTGSPAGWNFRQKLLWLFRRMARSTYNPAAQTIVTYSASGDPISTQSATNSGTTQATGEPQ